MSGPGGDSRRPAATRRRLVTVLAVLVAAGLAARGVLLVLDYVEARRRQAPRAAPPALRVRVLTAARRDAPVRVEATGFLASPATVRVPAETAGRLLSRLKQEGDPVRQGELLGVVDDAFPERRLEAQKARVEGCRAQLEYLDGEIRREERLVERNSSARAHLDELLSERRRAAAALAETEAGLRELELVIERCRIRAPRDGVWYQDLVQVGEYLQPGEPLGLLRVLDPLELEVEVSGRVRLGLAPGEEVEVEILDADPALDSLPQEVRSRIARLPPGEDPVSRRFPVVLEVPNPGRRLVPGLFCRARLELERTEPLLLLPKECVFERLGKPSAYVLATGSVGGGEGPGSEDGAGGGGPSVELRFLRVRELRDRPAEWLVLEGLEEGERVITWPIEQVVPGVRVEVEEERRGER